MIALLLKLDNVSICSAGNNFDKILKNCPVLKLNPCIRVYYKKTNKQAKNDVKYSW